MAISCFEGGFPFITFLGFHLVVETGEIQLVKSLDPSQPIQGFTNLRRKISILECEIILALIINIWIETGIELFVKNNGSSSPRLRRLNKRSYQMGLNVSF